nr:sensor domain-containing diguanylate cyclase [Paenibacillus roseus]
MRISEAVGFMLAYIVPICFFIHIGLKVLLRNPKKTEHLLASLISTCYLLLFVEEALRFLVPIEYSGVLSIIWFGSVGLALPSLGFHFFSKFVGMGKWMSKPLYPYLFYTPFLLFPVIILNYRDLAASQQFVQSGIWKWPLYNTNYYWTFSLSILVSMAYVVLLIKKRPVSISKEQRGIINLLITGILLVIAWHVVFGFISYEGVLPPYPFIYGGIIWCSTVWLAMKKYDFLDFNHKRYEKLFNLNPSPILLVKQSGRVREANPAARQLFHEVHLARAGLNDLGGEELHGRIQGKQEIRSMETALYNGNARIDVLVDGDYVSLSSEPHVMLIIRDITLQKAHQEQIAFLAYHDPLTQLPNRRLFYERLDRATGKASQRNQLLAVIVVNLEQFKELNDRYGYEAGDEALKHMAVMITEAVGSMGMAARLSGGKFAIMIEPMPSVAYVEETMRHLYSCFANQASFYYGEESVQVELSMGVSYYPSDGVDGSALIMKADKVLQRIG